MPETRQLAAIMFTDIVGYTALMGENEASAYQLLKKNRQVQKPIIEKRNGKWLKEMGDGRWLIGESRLAGILCISFP
jgi:class 3 adenylate cyclase